MSALASQIWTDFPRHRRVAQALAVLWILAMADLCLTIWAHRFTNFIELNPLAEAVLGFGFPALILFKLTTTMIGTLIFWRLRNHSRSELMLWGLVLVYVLLAMRWSQYTHGAVVSITLAQ